MAERILITGARSAVAVDLTRDFRRAGYEVHLADSSRARIARWSRGPQAVHRFAPPRHAPARFAADIADLAARIDPLLVVPTCEEVFHLARPSIANRLGPRLFAPPLALLRQLHHKHRFAELAARIGLDVPETHLLTGPACLARFFDDRHDWVFKPCFSRFGSRAHVAPATLAGIVPSAAEPWVAQRRIEGDECSFYAVAHAGRVTAFAAYAGSWRLGGGASFAFVPLPEASVTRIAKIARTLAAETGMTGQFSCDLIMGETEKPWVIECNPRATSGLHLLAREGALARAIARPGNDTLTPDARPRHMLPAILSYGLKQAITGRRMTEWRRALRTGSDVIGAPGDRWPVIGAVADTIGFALAARRARTSVTEATTADIEWNGEDLP